MLRYLGLVLFFCAASLKAADAPDQDSVPKPPPMPAEQPGSEPTPAPDQLEQEMGVEPDITIIQKEDRVVKEYRVNGQLYKVKITPKVGKPYYLLYPDGPNQPAVRRELDNIQTPYWVIFSW